MHFIDLAAQRARIEDRLKTAVDSVIDSGRYILGPEVTEFENRLADYVGAKHAIGCANGTDALLLPLMAGVLLYAAFRLKENQLSTGWLASALVAVIIVACLALWKLSRLLS